MTSPEERREVAEQLRKHNGHYYEELVNMSDSDLADLIDPTCHATLERAAHVMRCDACGLWFERFAVSTDGGDDWQPTRYCPSCGARLTMGGGSR